MLNMRAGGFTIQQALSSDAASIVKQSVTLAHRRGHAQVTPLHVANTMLSSTTGLLRTACVQSQSNSHPLQCKALELCFNVALNRLPTSSSSPMLNPNHSSQHPSISNALVAAFKRAQAHQRRGSIENQQQPLLAVKIELEQLIISILDDPSVSRVMREAGFSSTQVKKNIEQLVSLALSSHQTHPPIVSKDCTKDNSTEKRLHNDQVKVMNEDVVCVIEHLLNEKRSRSLVVVSESVATIEGVVGKVMEKVNKREVPEALKGVKFISLPLFSFGQLSRGDVEKRLGELRSLVEGFVQRGVVLYLGDLKWITEFRMNSRSHGRGYYCPIEHLIFELGRFVCDISDEISVKLRVMAISSFQTFMKCRSGNPSLEVTWKLHPLTIPAGSLSLSLVPQSDIQSECGSQIMGANGVSQMMCESGEEKQDTSCVDYSVDLESEAKSQKSSSFPAWLSDKKAIVDNQNQVCGLAKDLCKKPNSICTSVHINNERSLCFSSVSPPSQASCFSYNPENPDSNRNSSDGRILDFTTLEKTSEPYNLYDEGEPRQRFPSNQESTPNSASSSDLVEIEYMQKFREFNGKNLKILCNALEEKVPWQKDIVPDIVGTILKCRSRMMRRKGKQDDKPKEETWFLFQGSNSWLKEKIAKELAKIVFGSYSSFTTIALSNFSTSPRGDSTDEVRNKRWRDEQSCSYLERLAEEVYLNPHRVFFVEDVDQADYCSQKGIKGAIEKGKLTHSNGEEVDFCDAIIVLSCESFSSRSRTCSPILKKVQEEEESPNVSLDLNISFDEGNEEQSISMDDIGLLESVDKRINFSIQDLSL